MQITRRHFIAATATALTLPGAAALGQDAPPPPPPFTFDSVKEKAAGLAKQPFQANPDPLPQVLKDLDYSHFRMINYRPEKALWRDGGLFQIQLFHRGFVYAPKVTVNVIENGQPSEVEYSPDLFDFRQNSFKPEFDKSLGFSGFRLHFPLNRGDYFDEFAVYQGASYFRLIGRDQQYGLSGRGLSIDTALPAGEEFPSFREYWIERPGATTPWITIYALLDSKSTTGAYKFVLLPDSQTVAHVDLVVYPRTDIKKIGVGALTSMYLHGKPNNRPFVDQRPEVHDSDGLLIHNGAGEWLWRPLVNPRALQVSTFTDSAPKAYGLLQRERSFRQYEDLESNYQARPSAWIEPAGDWAQGAVELVEIPSDEEINDNIVSYWVPAAPVKGGESIEFSYKMTMVLQDSRLLPTGYCTGTRIAQLKPVEIAKIDHKAPQRFWVDFTSAEIASLGPTLPVDAVFTTSSGKIDDVVSEKLGADGWRAVFTFTPDGNSDADLRGFLGLRGSPLTETWTYHWSVA